ncbi:MAG: translation initiation factor [Chitinophagales bacterium]
MAKKKNDNNGFVFSTDPNFKFPAGDEEESESISPQQQMLKIRFEKKHRGGKEVTIIDEFIGSNEEMLALGKELKTKCGTGGSVKDGLILIQGDHRKKIGEILSKLNYKFKFAGG